MYFFILQSINIFDTKMPIIGPFSNTEAKLRDSLLPFLWGVTKINIHEDQLMIVVELLKCMVMILCIDFKLF